jgi:hypothetical protein
MIEKIVNWAKDAGMVFSWFGHLFIGLTVFQLYQVILWFLIDLFFPLPIPVLTAATIAAASMYDGREFGAVGDNATGRISRGEKLFRPPVFSVGGTEGGPLIRLDNLGDFIVPKIGILLIYGVLFGWIW